MLRRWCIFLAALAIAVGPALAASSASAATPPPLAGARLIASEAAHGGHASQPTRTAANSGFRHACRAVIVVGKQSCFALKRDGISPMAASSSPDAIPSGYGYGPSQLQAAYNLTAASAADGSGRTVALVDAYDDPNAASDLAAYRSAAGLPAVPGFEKVNQEGATSPLPSTAPTSDDWTVEESLDLDMVSAICPECKIVLVEADNDSGNGLNVAENTAASLAGYISNSWGGSESSTDTSEDSEYFNHPGDVITASAGDSDYGVIYPATSPNVVSVGGTRLSTASNSRGWTESVWNDGSGDGTGSGCSAYEPKPSWQAALSLPAGCSNRIDNDTSADADPDTGLAVYDTSNGNGGWTEVGGTSASSPMLAAMYALAGNAGSTPADDIYTHTSDFYDVTSGNDGSCSPAYLCTAETGYDGPTGIGTPDGIAGLATGSSSTGNTVTVTNPGSQTGAVGTAASLQISATDSASGQTLAYSATGLPAGLSISASSGLISGTPTTAGSYSVTVTATDSTSASGSASFTWTVGSTSTCTSTANVVGNPKFASGSADWTASSGVIGEYAADGEPPISGSNYDAWLDGYAEPHTDTLSQSVTVPAGCSGTLEVWLHVDSDQTSGTNGSFTIQVAGTTVATFTNLNANSGYTEYSYPLPTSDSGKSIKLLFTGTETNDTDTDYVVGEVQLLG
ncbi:MAG: putative Ig domain-containing protein [Actinobacteria bacterium]|nr:putative Ig domain-containing protein [Actinomycetota bacterium]